MPQMMPINWIMLMILFIFIFILFIIMNFYLNLYTKSNKMNKIYNFSNMNWKW